MAVFAIVGLAQPGLIGAKVAEVYPDDHYDLSATAWLVAGASSARDVGDKLALTGGALGAQALITPVGAAYFGWGPKGAWDWLSAKLSAAG